MNKKTRILLLFFILILSACSVLAQSDEGDSVGNSSAITMPKEEMIQEIQNEIGADEDLLKSVPGLKRQKDKNGKEFYTYLVDAQDVRLEDLDPGTLETILDKVERERLDAQTKTILINLEDLKHRPPQAPPQNPPRVPPRR